MSIIAPTEGTPVRDYFWLVQMIADWLHRTDLTERIPDFISLTDSRINSNAKVRAMEVTAALVLLAGESSVALPADYVSPAAVHLESQPRAKLTPLTPEQMPLSVNSGMPVYWCIDGGALAFNCPADVDRAITLRYRARFQLNAETPTNALLAKYPRVYLYGSLLESAPFLGHDERIGIWKGMFEEAVKEMNNIEQQGRSVAVLTTDVPMSMLGRRR